VVEVVAGHGFDDGLEGHGSALGVGDGAVGGDGQRGVDEEEIPMAEGGEGAESLGRCEFAVAGGPLVLIEGLDGGAIFGQGLAEAKGEDEFAVGEMAEDFGGAPLGGRWALGGAEEADRGS